MILDCVTVTIDNCYRNVGSLVIKAVQVEDAGHYTCEASNGVGSKGSEATADLQVFEAPSVHTPMQVINVRKLEDIRVTCTAHGSPNIQVSCRRHRAR